MLGIGLGGFVDGFSKGYGLKQDMEDRKQRRADHDREMAWEEENHAYLRGQRQRQQELDERQDKNREALEDIRRDADEQFQEGVSSGEYKPEDFDKFWKEYALPKMQHEMLLQGDEDGARKLMEWGDSKDAKEGARLFASGMFKAQTGDFGGALDDLIAAGKIKGYIAHDFEIGDKEPITDADGTIIGYRLSLKDSKGNEIEQDIALDDIPQMIATFGNPEAAWNSQQAAKADAGKRKADIDDFATKERIKHDINGDANASKDRAAAIKALRARMKADLANPDAVAFDDLPRDQQEKLIRQELDLQKGTQTPGATTPKVMVDSQTGQPVPLGLGSPAPDPRVVPGAPVSGLGQVPTAKPKEDPAIPMPGPGQAPSPRQPQPTNVTEAQAIDRAAQMMVEGRNPQEIAQGLSQAGIDPTRWPQELVRVLGAGGGPGMAGSP